MNPSKIIVPGAADIAASVKLAEQQEQLSQMLVLSRAAHINALAEAYYEETGLKPTEAMLIEQRGRDGSIRWIFCKRPPELMNFVPQTSPAGVANLPQSSPPEPTSQTTP